MKGATGDLAVPPLTLYILYVEIFRRPTGMGKRGNPHERTYARPVSHTYI